MRRKSHLTLFMMAVLLAVSALGIQPAKPALAANQVRISQAYGGGGNSGATYKNDFIELYNSGSTAVSLDGWSVQYASSTGSSWQVTSLSGSIQPNSYYLIQEAAGTGGTVDLPTPDAIGAIPMSGTKFKVALVASTVALSGSCPTGLVDFVGAGSDANCYEGSGAAPAPSNTNAVIRKENGCTDNDDNANDFVSAAPTPRNSSSPAYVCPVGDVPPTVASTLPQDGGTAQKTDDIVITFSESVTVADGWFSLTCGSSGTHTAVVTNADPTYTLNPDTDFTSGETCTVTIDHTKVTDNDAPADQMAADYTFSFTIAAGCGDPFTPIYTIQGSGSASPLIGQTHITEGVVVGDFQVGGKNGYYIQDTAGDGDTATSDGIFIYNTSVAVNVGDHVRVKGTVSEYTTGGGTLTQITPTNPAASNVTICSTGNTITPTELTLPVAAVSDFEKYEGMLVTFPQTLIISEYFNFDRYGEIVLTSSRHMTPTALVEPGAPAQAEAAAYLLDRITLDDGRTSQNPDPAIHPNGATFDMANLFRGGGTVTNVTGILDFYQSLYRVQPTQGAIYNDANPRTAAPDIDEGDLKIASFNVLNFFVTLDGSGNICGPAGNQECRGADNAEEFTRQRDKILSALAAIDADIFGLMEIENDRPGGGNPVENLVDGLNDIKGAGTYAYIVTGSIGTDAIKQAIIYKPASVTPVGDFELLTSAVDARFIDTRNRPALAQAFSDNVTGIEFVVAVNHLKSKGSACSDDPDLGDGQGNCNLTRKAAAEALVDWLANPTYFPNVEKALIIGDLNSYDKEDPIDAIKLGSDDTADTADDYLDMIYEFQGEYAYGYVYDGQTGYLDHALANQAMAEIVLDVNIWHINADEPDLIDYDTTFKLPAQDALYAPDAYRSSDHDPVIVTLNLNVAPVAADQSVTTDEDTSIDVTLSATDVNGDVLTFAIVDGPAHGSVTLLGNVATYTPSPNYNGADSFTFRANDGEFDSNSATVSITVTPLNDAPVAAPDSYSTDEDTLLTVAVALGVLANDSDVDGDMLTAILVTDVSHGTLALAADGSFVYTPAENFHGTDNFTYKASDGALESEPTTVTITVNTVNDWVVANDDEYETPAGVTLTVSAPGVLVNDVLIDVDETVSLMVQTQPSHGTLTLNQDGSFTYIPDSGFFGVDTFVYELHSAITLFGEFSDTATVTIKVTPKQVFMPLILR